MSFSEIEGQAEVVDFLKKAFEKNHLPHGLLFQGPANTGQRKVSEELAKMVFCENKNEGDSCGVCLHCRQVGKNTHPDFIVLAPGEDSQAIKIEEIRELIGKANLKPFQASGKFFVIEPADAMNDISQNALLKTLEEPLGRTFFVLISSSPEKLLATIRSRVQVLNFLPLKKSGEIDSEVKTFGNAVIEFILSGGKSKVPDLTKLDRETIGNIFDQAIDYFRELLVLRSGAGEILASAESLSHKKRQAGDYGEEELIEIIETLAQFKEKIASMVNTKLALSVLWDSLEKTHAQ